MFRISTIKTAHRQQVDRKVREKLDVGSPNALGMFAGSGPPFGCSLGSVGKDEFPKE